MTRRSETKRSLRHLTNKLPDHRVALAGNQKEHVECAFAAFAVITLLSHPSFASRLSGHRALEGESRPNSRTALNSLNGDESEESGEVGADHWQFGSSRCGAHTGKSSENSSAKSSSATRTIASMKVNCNRMTKITVSLCVYAEQKQTLKQATCVRSSNAVDSSWSL